VSLAEQLGRWRDWLTRLGAPVAPLLGPGADQDEIEAALGTAVPPSVREWFRWCNGIGYAPGQTIGDSYAIPGYWPIALRDAIAVKPTYQVASEPLLAHHWIPLLEDGSTDLYAAVWRDTHEPAVVSIIVEAGPAEVEFDTIEQMVSVFNACFARSAYFMNDQHRLAVDNVLYEEIYQALVGRPPP
jgi:hypothetical protein